MVIHSSVRFASWVTAYISMTRDPPKGTPLRPTMERVTSRPGMFDLISREPGSSATTVRDFYSIIMHYERSSKHILRTRLNPLPQAPPQPPTRLAGIPGLSTMKSSQEVRRYPFGMMTSRIILPGPTTSKRITWSLHTVVYGTMPNWRYASMAAPSRTAKPWVVPGVVSMTRSSLLPLRLCWWKCLERSW